MRTTRYIKIVGTALGAILLGAIGSGVWSELLAPLWNSLLTIIVKVFAYFSDSFKNSIYEEAAKGFHEKYSLTVLMILLGMFIGIYIALLVSHFLLQFERPQDAVKRFMRSRYEFIAFSFMVLVFVTMCTFVSIHSAYANKITTRSLNSIYIVAPYVDNSEVLRLKSQFHQIKTAGDYKAFYFRLKDLGEKHKLALPLFEPL
jgi:hypothetical protein